MATLSKDVFARFWPFSITESPLQIYGRLSRIITKQLSNRISFCKLMICSFLAHHSWILPSQAYVQTYYIIPSFQTFLNKLLIVKGSRKRGPELRLSPLFSLFIYALRVNTESVCPLFSQKAICWTGLFYGNRLSRCALISISCTWSFISHALLKSLVAVGYWLFQKFSQCIGNMRHNLATSYVFAEVVKLTNRTGLSDTECPWKLLAGMEPELRIHGFRSAYVFLIIQILANGAKFIKSSACCAVVNNAFSFHTANVFGWFGDFIGQQKIVSHEFLNKITLSF